VEGEGKGRDRCGLRTSRELSAGLKTVWTSFEGLQLAVILEEQWKLCVY
jgi:hypothetical protein